MSIEERSDDETLTLHLGLDFGRSERKKVDQMEEKLKTGRFGFVKVGSESENCGSAVRNCDLKKKVFQCLVLI